MSKTALYITGPMSGFAQFNHPLFHEVAALLRAMDYTVINPAEMDSPVMQELALKSVDGDGEALETSSGETWGDVLARDVRVISNEVKRIVLLPGWVNSRGAQLEAFVGTLCGVEFRLWDDGSDYLTFISAGEVLDHIHRNQL